MTSPTVTIADRFSAFFAKDEAEFWLRHMTNDEKKLSQQNKYAFHRCSRSAIIYIDSRE